MSLFICVQSGRDIIPSGKNYEYVNVEVCSYKGDSKPIREFVVN